MADASMTSGAWVGQPSRPSVLTLSISASHRVSHWVSSPCPRPRSSQDQQVVRDDPEAHPALHTHDASISAASETVPPLESADAPFTAGPPCEGGSNGARAPFAARPRQDHVPHPALVRGPLIGREAKPESATARRGARPKSSSCRTSEGTHRAWSGTRRSQTSSSVMNCASASWIFTSLPNSVGFTVSLPFNLSKCSEDRLRQFVKRVGPWLRRTPRVDLRVP
jgi:hypothetical protein